MKRLKQTTAAMSLMAGSYLFGTSLFMGAENVGVQANKLSEEYAQDTEARESVDARSKELSDRSVGRFAGGIMLLGCSAALAESCYKVRLKEGMIELTDELDAIKRISRTDELVLQGLYRQIRNGISLIDILAEDNLAQASVEVVGQGERT